MKLQKRIIAAAAGAAAVVLISHPASAATGLDKCAKAIQGEVGKTSAAVTKALQGCDAAYRTDQVKTPGTFTKSAAKCGPLLDKAIGSGGQTGKSLTKLQSLLGKSCSDSDLGLLGHPVQAATGDVWARAALAASVQHGYETAIAGALDEVGMLFNLGASGCASCKTLATAPCYEHACKYLSSGASGFNAQTQVLNITGDLIGIANFKLCNIAGLTPSGQTLVAGAVGKSLDPVALPGIGFVCVSVYGAEGVVGCNLSGSPAGSAPNISYHTCLDSNASGGLGGACAAKQVCTHLIPAPGSSFANNNDYCTSFTPAGSAAGASFVTYNNQLQVVLNAEVGADGKPCTADDTPATLTGPSANNLTTGTADTEVLNVDEGTGTIGNGPITGNAFNCSTIQSSNLAGAKIVGAFSAPNGILGTDSTTQFFLGCQ